MGTILPINRSFYSIRWKIVAAYIALLGIAFIVVCVMVMQLNADYLTDQRVRQELSRADALAVSVAEAYVSADIDKLSALLSDASQYGTVRGVLILDEYGTVQVDAYSHLNGTRMLYAEVWEVLSGTRDRSYGFHRAQTDKGVEWLGYFTSSVVYDARLRGALLISVSVQDVVDRLVQIQGTMYVYFAAVIFAVFLMGFFISDIITRPVNVLTAVMRRTSTGDFSARAPVKGRDEIAQLSSTFNDMSVRLENLDQMRNDFISSASHELKTPLASMKILIQSLLSGDEFEPEITRDFLGDVDKEIDRLSSIVVDLLALVQIDSKAHFLKLSTVNVAALIRDTVQRIKPFANKRGITLKTEIVENVELRADRQRLQQVIYNLLDNAVKYTQDGGMAGVTLDTDGRTAVIKVWDNGMGIPEADLPMLFDRFFRVDKARSRETGGTGLGLSIVRDIVTMHGGEISVQSKEDEGTVFTVTLPIDSDYEGNEAR